MAIITRNGEVVNSPAKKKPQNKENCLWKIDLDDNYVATECSIKVDFLFPTDERGILPPNDFVDPADFEFCPYCGKTITKIE